MSLMLTDGSTVVGPNHLGIGDIHGTNDESVADAGRRDGAGLDAIVTSGNDDMDTLVDALEQWRCGQSYD